MTINRKENNETTKQGNIKLSVKTQKQFAERQLQKNQQFRQIINITTINLTIKRKENNKTTKQGNIKLSVKTQKHQIQTLSLDTE